MQYSYFDSIKSKKCQPITVEQLVDRVKQQDIKSIASQILTSLEQGKEEEASRLKATLPVIVLGQLYEAGQPRSKNGGKPTGLLMIDYDDCKTTEEAQALMTHIKEKYISDLYLQDIIVAAHFSPRMHGVHIWYRWIDGCTSYEKCNERMAQLLDRPDYDQSCKDNSRCSFLVPESYFQITNWDAMDKNEPFAELQSRFESIFYNREPSPIVKNQAVNSQKPSGGSLPIEGEVPEGRRGSSGGSSYPTEYDGIEYSRIVKELTFKCAPSSKIDDEGNVMPGARDNAFFKLACLLRYICDFNVDWLISLAPEWAWELNNEQPGRVEDICSSVCSRNRSFDIPKTLRTVLESFKATEALEDIETSQAALDERRQQQCVEQLKGIEESKKKFLYTPEKLPPIFYEYCMSVKPEWRPAVILTLLPTLGTIMSKLRAKYLDRRIHSPSFQTVIEAPMAAGKGNMVSIASTILEPLVEKDREGNALINAYNKATIKNNGSSELGDEPDPCIRGMIGSFTEAGLNEVMNHSKGLHIWSGMSEIDQAASVWKQLSYILRLAYDNEMYGRTIQSIRQFRGERPLYLNTFLCGTPAAVKRVYRDPEDGLVSRTMFFKLVFETRDMPINDVTANELKRIRTLCKRLHDKYTIGDNDVIAEEQFINLNYLNTHIQKWLDRKEEVSTKYGKESIDRFRRRDAVNGFRAGMIAHAIYLARGKKISDEERKVVKEFAEWVAEYSLTMHEYKFGEELCKILEEEEYSVPKKSVAILDSLPDSFTLSEAYKIFSGQREGSVRTKLSRLVNNGALILVDRGVYAKNQV